MTSADTFGNPDSSAHPNFSGNRVGNFEGGIGSKPDFSMQFATNMSAAAFALVGADGGVATVVAYLNGMAVESFVFNTSASDPVNYYGFLVIAFDETQIKCASR